MKADKVWNERMPTGRLTEVLPEGSPLQDQLAPPAQTGMTSGVHALTGLEPYLYDTSQFVGMGDLTINGDSYVYDIVQLNDDLYVFGDSRTIGGDGPVALIGRWDPVTRTWDDLSDTSTIAAERTFHAVLLDADIYFTYVDSSTVGRVGHVDGATDQVTELQLPVTGSVSSTQLINQELVIAGQFGGGVDVVTYDPAAAAGSEFSLYSLPGDASITNALIGAAGHYAYFFASNSNLYSVNVETGAVTLAFAGVNGHGTELDTNVYLGNGTIGGDLYASVITTSGNFQILRADDLTGTASVVYSSPDDDGIWYDHVLRLAEQTDTALWYIHFGSGFLDKITKISADGSVHTYDTNANQVAWVQELNGTAYVGAMVANVFALYRLNDDGSLTFIRDFDGGGSQELPVSTVDDHLVVWTDSDHDGNRELWTSATPEVPESWIQISPDDVNVTWQYAVVLEGDYLI